MREHADFNISVLLVGNKSDLKKNRAVSTEEAAAYAEAQGMIFMEIIRI